MANAAGLAEVLLRERLITQQQLKTAQEMQKTLGGEIKDILVKMGFVKDSVIQNLVAEQQHVQTREISDGDIDFDMMRKWPKDFLAKHQVIPLRGSGGGAALQVAVEDAGNFQVIEDVQFLTNRVAEPVLVSKATIRRALNTLEQRLPELEKEDRAAPRIKPAALKAIGDASTETLVRTLLVSLIEKGELSADEVTERIARITKPAAAETRPRSSREVVSKPPITAADLRGSGRDDGGLELGTGAAILITLAITAVSIAIAIGFIMTAAAAAVAQAAGEDASRLNLLANGLFYLNWIIYLGSCAWAAYDSSRMDVTRYESGLSYNPIVLFILVAILWPIAFPWYLSMKFKIGRGDAKLRS